MNRREFRDLVTPDVAREAIGALDIDGGVDDRRLVDACGLQLAERVDAMLDVPGFDRAAMDGYAVRASATFGASEGNPVRLPVVGAVHAGSAPDVDIDEGESVRIATGAVLPPGANAVVPVEDTVEGDDDVDVVSPVAPGDSVMFRGADIAAGDRALGPGTRLGPRHVGLLAATGRKTVSVRTPPRIAVVSTGEELAQPGTPLTHARGQIYDVNGHSLAAAVEAAGGEAVRYVESTDDESALRDTLREATADADLVLTSGSTSAGTADVLYDLLESHGERLVHGVALKPGRPLLVGRLFGTPYVGLPGYPVSALSVFRTFVAPALTEAADRSEAAENTTEATLATRVRYDGGRLRLVPVGLVTDGDGGFVAYASMKGSGATTTLVETDGIVRMQPETSLLAAGSAVTVEPFDGTPVPTLLGVGDPDPVVGDLFDTLDATRYLTRADADATRWLDDGIPDVVVTGKPVPDGERLVSWSRDWGLLVPADDPFGLSALRDLVDTDCRFANLAPSLSVRRAFDDRLDAASIDAGSIDGYHPELPGIESAARSVATGDVDAGLGLCETAQNLGVGFVPVGTQQLTLTVNPDRTGKESVDALRALVADSFGEILSELSGYERTAPPEGSVTVTESSSTQ
jgi:putative molybdopterin biosynthesis protein